MKKIRARPSMAAIVWALGILAATSSAQVRVEPPSAAAQLRVPVRYVNAAGLPTVAPLAAAAMAASPAIAPVPIGPVLFATIPLPKTASLTLDASQARLDEALRLLLATPSGAELFRLAEAGGTRIIIRKGYDQASYSDEEDQVQLGPEFMSRYDARELATFIAHELEHARQNHLMGVRTYFALEREWGALSAEARVWVELGAPFDRERWRRGNAFLREHVLWTRYPRSTFYSWEVRNNYALTTAQAMAKEGLRPYAENVKAYWERSLVEEAEWRRLWTERMPVFSDEMLAESFRGLMHDSVRVMHADRMPDAARELASRLSAHVRFDGR